MAFFTDKLGFVKQLVGENPTTWGSVLNSQFIDLADEAIAGLATVNVTNADRTITISDGVSSDGRAMILEVEGSPPIGRTVSVPSLQKLYIVHNNTGQTLTVKPTVGSGLEISAGARVLVAIDGDLAEALLVSVGEKVIAAGPDEFSPVPCTIDDALLGDTEPDYLTYSEGPITTVRTLGFNVFVRSSGFVLRTQSTNFVEQIFFQDRPMVIRENSSYVEAYARLTPSSIEFFKADGSDWVVDSQRIVYSHDWSYSTAET